MFPWYLSNAFEYLHFNHHTEELLNVKLVNGPVNLNFCQEDLLKNFLTFQRQLYICKFSKMTWCATWGSEDLNVFPDS